jgi:hypothetical protein
MKKDRELQPKNDAQNDLQRAGPEKQHKGYNEQNPSQPHGSFKRDADATGKIKPTSVKKRLAEKRF